MATGKILRFYADRGFGFIKPDGGGPDLFLHISELGRNIDPHAIQPSTLVTYEEEDAGRGPKAVNVMVLDTPLPLKARPAQQPDEPEQPTEAAWRALWDKVSDAAFEALMAEARDNGWVQA